MFCLLLEYSTKINGVESKKKKKKFPHIYNLQVQILKYDDVLVSKKAARVNDFLFAVSDIPNKEGNIEN